MTETVLCKDHPGGACRCGVLHFSRLLCLLPGLWGHTGVLAMQDTPPCARVLEQEQLSWPKDQQHPAGRRGQRRKDVSREGKSASRREPPELARKGREPGEVGGLQKKRQTGRPYRRGGRMSRSSCGWERDEGGTP